MKKSEFGFIGDIAAMFGALPHAGFEPIGDDCTVLPMGDEALVMTTDMLIEDIHFLRGASSPEEVGEKSLMVNISDVAAMGAKPIATLLSIALPEAAQGEWAERFMRGYYEASEREGVALVGGDTTASRDKVAINVVAIGRAPMANIKRRAAAKVGDIIAVTGKLGISSKGLVDIMFGDLNTAAAKAHRRGQARVAEGVWLGTRTEVHAMMDISDGIASDLQHILDKSKKGAEVKSIPTAEGATISAAFGVGEDYELLLTVDKRKAEELAQRFEAKFGKPLYNIGRVVKPNGDCYEIGIEQEDGSIVHSSAGWGGYHHF